MDDYIDLGPDDVIREGDQYSHNWFPWRGVAGMVGRKFSDFPESYRFRRPRHVAIREAALELLRKWYAFNSDAAALFCGVSEELQAMMDALGVSVEELRGG